MNPGVLPDTVVAYCDSTIAFPLFCEYAIGSPNGRRPRKELVHQRERLVAELTTEAKAARDKSGSCEPRQSERCRPDGDAVVGARRRTPSGCRRGRASTPTRTCRPGSSASCATSSTGTCSSSSRKTDLRRAPDVKHYRLAQQLRRTLVTMDRDYLDDRRFPPEEGGGVLVINAPDERAVARAALSRVDRLDVPRAMQYTAAPRRCPSRAPQAARPHRLGTRTPE